MTTDDDPGGERRRSMARDDFDDLFVRVCCCRRRWPGRWVPAVLVVLDLRGRQTTDDDPITAKELKSSIVVYAVVPRSPVYINIG